MNHEKGTFITALDSRCYASAWTRVTSGLISGTWQGMIRQRRHRRVRFRARPAVWEQQQLGSSPAPNAWPSHNSERKSNNRATDNPSLSISSNGRIARIRNERPLYPVDHVPTNCSAGGTANNSHDPLHEASIRRRFLHNLTHDTLREYELKAQSEKKISDTAERATHPEWHDYLRRA